MEKFDDFTTLDIVKNIFILLLPFIVYSTTYIIPELNDINSDRYRELHHSRLSLPPWLLFLLWSLIYIVMGASTVKVIYQKKYIILILYIIQIVSNYLRARAVNKTHNPKLALIMSVIFLISVIILNIIFFKRNKKSGTIFLFYTLWALYIFYLQLSMKYNLF